MRSSIRLYGLAVAMLSLLAVSCVDSPDADYVASGVRTESRLSADEVKVRSDSQERTLRRATLRIRARSCFGVGTGSGFAITDQVLVTNRHVVEGADLLQVSTWDGQTLDVAISGVAMTEDLALVLVRGQLPVSLELHARPRLGDEVVAVGYPLGGELTFSHGRVLGEDSIDAFGRQTPVVRMSNTIQPGNSGGPLLDEEGRVVGVVFAVDTRTGDGLAIPVEMLKQTIQEAGFFENPSPC